MGLIEVSYTSYEEVDSTKSKEMKVFCYEFSHVLSVLTCIFS